MSGNAFHNMFNHFDQTWCYTKQYRRNISLLNYISWHCTRVHVHFTVQNIIFRTNCVNNIHFTRIDRKCVRISVKFLLVNCALCCHINLQATLISECQMEKERFPFRYPFTGRNPPAIIVEDSHAIYLLFWRWYSCCVVFEGIPDVNSWHTLFRRS